MQRIFLPILAVLAVAAGVFAYRAQSEVEVLREKLAAISAEREAAAAVVARLKSGADAAAENVARLTAERDAALARAKTGALPPPRMPLPQADAPGPGGESGGKMMMEGIAKMFSTEEGRKMMRSQAAMGVKMMYGTLAADLKLDPAVADQVLSLIGDRQAAMSEMAFGAMKGGVIDEAAGKEMATKGEALKKEYDAKLRGLVGDEGLKQIEGYERTAGDRMMLTMNEHQFSAAGAPLEPAQKDSLLQIMTAERAKTPPGALDANGYKNPARGFSALNDDAAVERWLSQEEAYQQRVLTAAPRTLNPDQVNALRQTFKQQLEMSRLGAKMGREMFKGGSGSVNVIVAPGGAAPVPAK